MVIEDGRIALRGPYDAHQASGGQYSLANSAKVWALMWRILKALGVNPDSLSTPSSSRLRISFKSGAGSSTSDQTSNPRFYEKVMGWPTDWTAPEGRVTGFAAWLRLSRGRHCELTAADE